MRNEKGNTGARKKGKGIPDILPEYPFQAEKFYVIRLWVAVPQARRRHDIPCS
jgi:hypothetical protein